MSIDAMKQALAVLDDVLQLSAEHSEVRAALRAAIEQAQEPVAQKPVAWVYAEGLQALNSGKPWVAYGRDGDGRIPLYLNDAVAPRVEPRASESGAGFESLPASSRPPGWWANGLTSTLMREGINKHRAREIAQGYWEAYCEVSDEH